MMTTRNKKTKGKAPQPRGLAHEAVLARHMAAPKFKAEFERRRLVHEVAVAVRAMREEAGFTQAQLAAKIGVTQPVIGRLERALEQRRPRFDLLQRIGQALGRQLKFVFVKAAKEQPLVEVEGMDLCATRTDNGAETDA
jgi:ribosome-binding protein aMBF1 (putative translation factor)